MPNVQVANDEMNPPLMERSVWMSVLARASVDELNAAFANFDERPEFEVIKAAEIGSVMVEARAGGSGRRFNNGEATVTRCVVRVASSIGISYALGRCPEKVKLAAIVDALIQEAQKDKARQKRLIETFIVPFAERQVEARNVASRKAASTKVEFFTMVRGEG